MNFRQFPSRPRTAGRGRMLRALSVILLGLQALLWGGGSIIEAQAAAESLSRLSHVEDQGTTACPPLHSHVDCVICRTLNGGAAGASAPALPAAACGESGGPVTDLAGPADRGLFGTLGSRGPPRV